MLSIPTSPFNISMLRKTNTWYTIADGNWGDPNIWISNGKRKHQLPQPHDNVYVNHAVILDGNVEVGGLNGFGQIIFGTSTRSFTVNNSTNFAGMLNMNDAPHYLTLLGYYNYIFHFISGDNSTVNYTSALPYQPIMATTYANLYINSSGLNILTSDTIVSKNLIIDGKMELSRYDFTVYGTTTLNQPSKLSKNSNIGNTLFNGLVSAFGGDGPRFNLLGNPDIEFRGGIILNQYSTVADLGTGTMLFSTNNQTITGLQTFNFGANILIASGVTLSVTENGINCYGLINGEDITSTLNNDSLIYISNSTLPMSTGVFNYKNTLNTTLGYTFSGDLTLPYSEFENLTIAGTGVKTLSADTVINYNLLGMDSGSLECSAYALQIKGKADFIQPSLLSKNTNTGLLLFEGRLTSTGGDNKRFDFSGNPNIEFRSGFSTNVSTSGTNLGTGTIRFTTNDQVFELNGDGLYLSNPIIIDGLISVEFTRDLYRGNYAFNLTNEITGTNLNSTLINKAIIKYANDTEPMSFGILQNIEGSIFEYNSIGDQDVQSGIYDTLILSNGGAKKLLGDVIVNSYYSLVSPATLDNNGFLLL